MSRLCTSIPALFVAGALALCPGTGLCQKRVDYVQVVRQALPAITLSCSAATAPLGTSVTFTAKLSGSGSSPSGAVDFLLGSSEIGSATLNPDGSASFSSASLPAGQDRIVAFYPGDANYAQAASSPALVEVVGLTPQVTVLPAVNVLTDRQSLRVAISVGGIGGQPTPIGTVALSGGSYSGEQRLVTGGADFNLPAGVLPGGGNQLTVTYSGDSTYRVASGTATVTVAEFVIAVTSPAPVSAGASSTSTVKLAAGGTYSGTAIVRCALSVSPNGAQSLPTCGLSPPAVPLLPGGSGTSLLTIKTTAASSAVLRRLPGGKRTAPYGGGALLACLLIFCIPRRRLRRMGVAILLGVVAAAGTIGCGGTGSMGPPPENPGTPATTPGSYTFTVTGVDATNPKIAVSTDVSFIVQQ